MRLLLVEDDRALADELQALLETAGYAVDHADDGENALYLGQTEEYDLVILDLGLPRLSGIQVLEGWRGAGRAMPVLILTARDTWREKVLGLKAGADDYLTKPFHPEELLARLGALLRRAHGRAVPEIASKAFYQWLAIDDPKRGGRVQDQPKQSAPCGACGLPCPAP